MFLILRTPIVWYNLGVMIQPYIAIAVAFGIAGLLALPGAMGLKLRMIRLKSAELVLFLAMAAIGTDNNIYTNTIVATSRVDKTDILIGLLQSEMPDAVSPAKLLPAGYEEFICNGTRIPVCQFDYEEKGLVYEIERPLASYATTRTPLMPSRIGFYENTVVGDSGNPVYLIINNSLVLLGVLHTGNAVIQTDRYEGANAPFTTYYATKRYYKCK